MALPPREQIARRLTLMRCALSDAPRRYERDEDFARRIADDIERQARRLLEDCDVLRRGRAGADRAAGAAD